MMKTGHFEFVYPATPRRLRTRTNKGGTVFFIFCDFFGGGGCMGGVGSFHLKSIIFTMTGILKNHTMLKF